MFLSYILKVIGWDLFFPRVYTWTSSFIIINSPWRGVYVFLFDLTNNDFGQVTQVLEILNLLIYIWISYNLWLELARREFILFRCDYCQALKAYASSSIFLLHFWGVLVGIVICRWLLHNTLDGFDNLQILYRDLIRLNIKNFLFIFRQVHFQFGYDVYAFHLLQLLIWDSLWLLFLQSLRYILCISEPLLELLFRLRYINIVLLFVPVYIEVERVDLLNWNGLVLSVLVEFSEWLLVIMLIPWAV